MPADRDATNRSSQSQHLRKLYIDRACLTQSHPLLLAVFELLFTHPLWAYRTGTFAFASAWPLWLLAVSILVAVALIAATLWRRRQLGWRLLLPVGILQSLLAAAVLCLLWRPVLNVERVRDRENVLAVAIDASASMAYGEADRSRLQEVAAALQKGTLAKLEDTFEVRLFSFAQTTTPLDSLEAIPAPGPQTRIGDSLVQVLQSAGSIPLAGVVLFSDGAENGGSLSEERLTEIASYGVPIHTVGVGPGAGRRRSGAGAPRRAHERAGRLDRDCAGRHSSQGAGATRLRVYDRDTLIAARDIQLAARHDRDEPDASICRPASPARTSCASRSIRSKASATRSTTRARASSMCRRPGATSCTSKASRAGNTSSCGAPPSAIARCASRAWCARRRTSTTARASTRPAELGEGFPVSAGRAVRLRRRRHRQLRSRQPAPRAASIAERVRRSARRLGADARGSPRSRGRRLAERGARADPAGAARRAAGHGDFVQRPVHAQPTLYGAAVADPALRSDPKRNADRWKNLPALADYQTLGRLKPGAIVLLEGTADRARTPLLLWQHYGRGATFVLATASTLRWQMQLPPEDESHEVFWRQLLHAISATAPPRASIEPERHRLRRRAQRAAGRGTAQRTV